MSARRERALALRKHSLDMVPKDAYWRDATTIEAKLDIQAAEAAEGRALETARIQIAVALTQQMQDVLDQVTRPDWSLRTSTLTVDTYDVEIAFARLVTTAYFDGAIGLHRDARREDAEHVIPPTVGLSAAGTEDLIATGLRMGRTFANGIITGLQFIVDAALRDGRGVDRLVPEIQSRYASLIDLSEFTGGITLTAARVQPKTATPKAAKRRTGRRMKVADRQQHEQWQKQYLPFSKRMRQTLETYQREARLPKLNADQSKVWVQTEYSRAVNHGTIDQATMSDDVASLAWTALRDSATCQVCLDRDGVVRPKGDEFWLENTPPAHPRCRCSMVPVLVKEKVRVTPKKDLPDSSDLSPGWGGFDRNAVRDMRRLGRVVR